MREAMEQVRGQKDKDTKAVDEMEEAYQELIKNTKEAHAGSSRPTCIFSPT